MSWLLPCCRISVNQIHNVFTSYMAVRILLVCIKQARLWLMFRLACALQALAPHYCALVAWGTRGVTRALVPWNSTTKSMRDIPMARNVINVLGKDNDGQLLADQDYASSIG